MKQKGRALFFATIVSASRTITPRGSFSLKLINHRDEIVRDDGDNNKDAFYVTRTTEASIAFPNFPEINSFIFPYQFGQSSTLLRRIIWQLRKVHPSPSSRTSPSGKKRSVSFEITKRKKKFPSSYVSS